MAEATNRGHQVGVKAYIDFTTAHEVTDPLPVTRESLLAFATYRASFRCSSYSSIRGYLTGVRHLCVLLGFSTEAFECPRLQLLLRSIKKRNRPLARRTRLPITVWILLRMLPSFSFLVADDVALWAVMTVAVYGLFRAGELVKKGESFLLRQDVTWTDEYFEIHLRTSKTDVFGVGTTCRVYKNGSASCPYSAFQRHWLRARDKSSTGAAFQTSSGSPYTYRKLHAEIKQRMIQLGFSKSEVGTHSLRAGGATTLAMMGCPTHLIKARGRWSSLAFQGYIHVPPAAFAECSRLVGRASPNTAWFGGRHRRLMQGISLDNFEIRLGA